MLKAAWIILLVGASLALGYYAVNASAAPEAKTVDGWNRRLHIGMDKAAIDSFLHEASQEKKNFHPYWHCKENEYKCVLRDVDPTSRTRKDIVLMIYLDDNQKLKFTETHTVMR